MLTINLDFSRNIFQVVCRVFELIKLNILIRFSKFLFNQFKKSARKKILNFPQLFNSVSKSFQTLFEYKPLRLDHAFEKFVQKILETKIVLKNSS